MLVRYSCIRQRSLHKTLRMSNFSQSGNETSYVWINVSSSHSHLVLKSQSISTKKPYGLPCARTQKLFNSLALYISIDHAFQDVAMKQLWESFYNTVKSHQISDLQSNKFIFIVRLLTDVSHIPCHHP